MSAETRMEKIVKAKPVRKHTLLVGYALALLHVIVVLQLVELFR